MSLFACLLVLAAPIQDSTARITFLDVGQGDAALVEAPEGKVALIDGGPRGAGVAGILQEWGLERLDLVIASHAHEDHIGGLPDVLATFAVRSYMDNGRPHSTVTYDELMALVEESDATYLEATAREITLGSITIRVLPPSTLATDQNGASVGIMVEYGEFRALLVGDADQDALNHFLRLGVPPVAVLKAAHHGARNGLTPGWLDRTTPQVVIISVSADNAYGHPDPWALRYYQTVSEMVFRTDLHGDVRIEARRDGSFAVEVDDGSGQGVEIYEFPVSTRGPQGARE